VAEEQGDSREILSEFQSLVKSLAWERLVDLAREQITIRTNVLLTLEEKGLEDLLEVVRLKAEIRAFKLWIAMPDALIDGLKEELGYAVVDEAEAAG